jgi:Icc-related predicted phosphoesterase
MDAHVVTAEIEESLSAQLQLAGDDPHVVEASEAIMAGLAPAIDRAVMHLAEQAASEVDAQLMSQRVGVELREGAPVLVVHGNEDTVRIDTDDLEARITLRLSEKLKSVLEDAAGEAGESVNTFVVKTLAGKATERGSGRRYSGTIET